jgi:hypothetical protein
VTKPSKQYTLFFKIAAGVVPVIMAAAGYFYGDITPVVRDVCGTLLPAGTVVTRPSVTVIQDAGAPR